MEKMNGKRVMQSALDQWATVEQLKATAKQIVPKAQADMMDRCVAEKADRSLQILNGSKSKRTPPPEEEDEDITDSPTEEKLVMVLSRLQGTSGAK
jgi:hypothetical protein